MTSMNTQTKGEPSRFIPRPAAQRLVTAVAVVSGLFSLIVCILLIANYLQIKALDPINQPELLALRAQLAESSDPDPVLVQQVRAMDLLARKAFFTSQAHLRMGGQLLLGGVVVFLIALKLAGRWAPQLPAPGEGEDPQQHWASRARTKEAIAFTSLALVTLALLAAYFTPLNVPSQVAANDAEGAAQEVQAEDTEALGFPDWEVLQQQWPTFRGPGGYGVAHDNTAPTDWDAASGKNIRWKVAVPLPGFNSPVVWDKHLFLTGASEDALEVYCYDVDTGELRWKRPAPKFPGSPEEWPRVSEDTGYAASTMAVHGELAYAIFGTGDIVCYDFAGEQRWGRNLGVPDNHYGHSSSLIAYDNLLFVQYDHKGGPKLLALNAATGEEAWVAERRKISWASPACIQTASGPQLILNSELDVDAYDPKTGRLLWNLEALDGEVAPSPAYTANMVFVANEYAMGSGIRLDTTGGEAKAEIAWQWDDILPEVSSPVGAGNHFYLASSMGDIVCLAADTGEEVWVEEYDQGFYSSPILVGDRIYILDFEGTMHIFGTGAEYALIAAPKLDEKTFATPAYLDERIYLRTEEHLLCIEEADEQ